MFEIHLPVRMSCLTQLTQVGKHRTLVLFINEKINNNYLIAVCVDHGLACHMLTPGGLWYFVSLWFESWVPGSMRLRQGVWPWRISEGGHSAVRGCGDLEIHVSMDSEWSFTEISGVWGQFWHGTLYSLQVKYSSWRMTFPQGKQSSNFQLRSGKLR